MNAIRPNRQWLFYFALALPAILAPHSDFISINRSWFTLGLLIPGMHLRVGDLSFVGNGHRFSLHPDPLLLPISIALWTGAIWLAWKVRQWAAQCPGYHGPVVQALITASYGLLLLWFLSGVTEVCWEWRLLGIDDSLELATAFRFARRALPILYTLAVGCAAAILVVDSFSRSFRHRLVYLASALCLCGGVGASLAPYCDWQLRHLDELILDSQKQAIKQKN